VIRWPFFPLTFAKPPPYSLKESERELRQRLEMTSNSAMAREKERLDEIDRLREAIRDWDVGLASGHVRHELN
jgi:hypothetical protein